MSDELKHECAVAMVVLRKAAIAADGFGSAKLSLLLEKQHNRGQDGAGAAILRDHPEPGSLPYELFKSASATPLADLLGLVAKRGENTAHLAERHTPLFPDDPVKTSHDRIFLGHLRYATFGKNDVAFCHPFVHQSSELAHTLLLAGNFNLTNAGELFDAYERLGEFPTSKSDGYLICELIAHELSTAALHVSTRSTRPSNHIADALSSALASADGAWTLCGMTGDGWAFATRDPHGIRPGFFYIDDDVVVVASERPAIQAAFDVSPEAVRELPPGQAMVISPDGDVEFVELRDHPTIRPSDHPTIRPCVFERIYFSRANDANIHRERKALGAALLPQILEAADAPLDDIFFSYIPNSARIAFHGLLEELFSRAFSTGLTGLTGLSVDMPPTPKNLVNLVNPVKSIPRFGEVIVKDAKFRTFIADAAARREFYKHVYDVTYGLVRQGKDTLVVLDDSIVRGNTMKNAILPMLDRLGPKRIVVASSAPPIRYPDCYGIDMSTLGELVAFKALVNLLDGERGTGNRERVLRATLDKSLQVSTCSARLNTPLAQLYSRFTDEQHCTEIARLLTPPGMKAEVKVVFQTVENLRRCIQPSNSQTVKPSNRQTVADGGDAAIGDWYFTGDYPTPGGYKVLHNALQNYLDSKGGRSY